MTDETLPLARRLHDEDERHTGVPMESLNKHLFIGGTTGSGKSTTGCHAVVLGHDRTDGATVVINPKETDWTDQILRAQYKTAGSLEDVYVFDATSRLPAISFFDLRPHLAAGIPRAKAVEELTENFLQILSRIKQTGRTAVRAPDVIRHLIKALFDPRHGHSHFQVSTLLNALTELRETNEYPPTDEEWFDHRLGTDVQTARRSGSEAVLDGVQTRVEKFKSQRSLEVMFDHSPANPADAFRFDPFLDDDALLIFDISDAQPLTRRVIANTLLSELWWALTRRDCRGSADPSTVLCFIDEAPKLDIDGLLQRLFDLGRSTGLGLVPMFQFTDQLDDAVYNLLNNVQNYLLGRMPADDVIVKRLADSSMPAAELRNRLTELRDDRWLLKSTIPRGGEHASLELVKDLPLPPGHPEGEHALSRGEQNAFESARATRRECTRDFAVSYPTVDVPDDDTPEDPPTESMAVRHGCTLPRTLDFPSFLEYRPDAHAIECLHCNDLYAPTFEGLCWAIQCCGGRQAVDREDIPVVSVPVLADPAALEAAGLSAGQAIFLGLVWRVAYRDPHPLAFDRAYDSMTDLRRLANIDTAAVTELTDELSYLREASKRTPHKVYDLTEAGRDLLGVHRRHGRDIGPYAGDLGEGALHRTGVRLLAYWAWGEYVAGTDTPGTRVQTYYPVEAAPTVSQETELARPQVDVAVLDAAGSVVAAGEVELRTDHSHKGTVQDYRKLAALEPADAIWAFKSRAVFEAVTASLADADCIPQSISGVSPRMAAVDEPGFSQAYTLTSLKRHLNDG